MAEFEGIAVLGSHPQTVMQAPFDGSWKIYACSPHNFEHRELPLFHEWFELHIPIPHQTRQFRYCQYLTTLPLVWVRDTENMHHFPGAKLYPEEEYKQIENFGPYHFTSSIAYMLARAIKDCEELGVDQIGIWGVMQASETEYMYQRPGIQFMILEANRRGIGVIAPEESRLFEPMPDGW